MNMIWEVAVRKIRREGRGGWKKNLKSSFKEAVNGKAKWRSCSERSMTCRITYDND